MANNKNEARPYVEPLGKAPIEMLSELLVKVNSGQMEEAAALSRKIREIEPDNTMMAEYISVLEEYINEESDDGGNDDDDYEYTESEGDDVNGLDTDGEDESESDESSGSGF